jgi:hypothetical protein
VLTPRQIFLFLLGLCGIAAVIYTYSIALGGINGLPILPEKYLARVNPDSPQIPQGPYVSPVEVQLERAFGAKCPELENPAYKTKIELRDRGLVFAAGPIPEIKEPTKRVKISPMSVAIFSKQNDKDKSETAEIMTLHSDEAILEYDKPIKSRTEILKNEAKLIGVELISNSSAQYRDLRKGRIIVTHNQRSNDPSRWLIVRTDGPVYYQTSEAGKPLSPDVPMIRTSAKIEIINRSNMPKPLWSEQLFALASDPNDPHANTVVADMILGNRVPPPTVIANGLKMYFSPEPAQAVEPGKPAKPASQSNRLSRIEFNEQVHFSIWMDKSEGFPTASPKADNRPLPIANSAAVNPVAANPATVNPANPLAPNSAISTASNSLNSSTSSSGSKTLKQEPPIALAGAAGVLVGSAYIAQMKQNATLLTIDTLGPFKYDAINHTARFESAAIAQGNQVNYVQVERNSANGTRDTLDCKVLDIVFDNNSDSPTANAPGNQSGIKSLHARGDHVHIKSESDQMTALGTELFYESDRKSGKSSLIFRGNPIEAVRGLHLLKTAAGLPSELIFTSTPGPIGPDKKPITITNAIIRGPGSIALHDPASNGNTITATWATSFTQTKELINGRNLDLFVFDGGKFVDTKAGFELSGEVLKLWLENNSSQMSDTKQAVPYQLMAIKNVHANSPDFIIEESDLLTVWFKQGQKIVPRETVQANKQSSKNQGIASIPNVQDNQPLAIQPPKMPGQTANNQPNTQQPTKAEPVAKKPNPLRLTAKTIDAWILRSPVDQSSQSKAGQDKVALANGNQQDKADKADQANQVKYELEKAICIEKVDAHQPPEDTKKFQRGLDLRGHKLTLERQTIQDLSGFAVELIAAKDELAEFHHENTSLIGPKIYVDQLKNYVRVFGRGGMKMPAGSSLSGTGLGKPDLAKADDKAVIQASVNNPKKESAEMKIEWLEGMEFRGADGFAVFLGKVQAEQETTPINGQENSPDAVWGKAYLLCHKLTVRFDRPIYFNQFRKPNEARPANDNPKISQAYCQPEADEDSASPNRVDQKVFFEEQQIRRDNSVVKKQRVRAGSLDFRSADVGGGTLLGSGPGEVRTMQMGTKENKPGVPNASTTNNSSQDNSSQEMKLTVVNFKTGMKMEDNGNKYQTATFEGDVRAHSIPTTEFERTVELHSQLPERSITITAEDKLALSTYKPASGKVEQKMIADGNAQFKSDEYRGRASKIRFDGNLMTLEGSNNRLAVVEQVGNSNTGRSATPARKLVYDVVEKRIQIIDGATGAISR